MAGMLSTLVELGFLKLDAEAESADRLLKQGIDAMTHPGLKAYEDQFGEYVQLQVGTEGFHLNLWQDCHAWRMRLKPIITALPIEEAAAFVNALGRSQVQGPSWWDDAVGFSGAGEPDEDDPEDDMQRYHLPQKKGAPGAGWMEELFAKYPALDGRTEARKRNATLMEQLVIKEVVELPLSMAPPPAELRPLVAAFIETTQAVAQFGDNCAIMVTTWDKDCHVNHGHDYIHKGIHEDGWDNQDGSVFCLEADSIEKLREGMDIIGRFIAAATALESWSNNHC